METWGGMSSVKCTTDGVINLPLVFAAVDTFPCPPDFPRPSYFVDSWLWCVGSDHEFLLFSKALTLRDP